MNTKTAKKIFEEIVELCYESGNFKIIETIESIYSEVEEADDIATIVLSVEELQVIINEADILEEEEEVIQEVKEKIELFLE